MTEQQKEKLFKSITDIDDKFIEEAALKSEGFQAYKDSEHKVIRGAEKSSDSEKKIKLRRAWRLGLGIAAALAITAAGIIFFTKISPEGGKSSESTPAGQQEVPEGKTPQASGEISGETEWPTRHILPNAEDADAQMPSPSEDEIAYVKHWDEKDFNEKYNLLDYEGETYVNHAVPVSAARKGELLADGLTAYGYDPYLEGEDQIHRVPAKVYEIIGVSRKVAVAVEMEGPNCEACLSAFVLSPSDTEASGAATLGDLLADWNLAEDLRIGTVYVYQDKDVWAQGYGTLCFDGADTAEVFRTLFKDTSLERLEELPDGTQRILYSISISDDTLGIENHALSVYEGGYLWTNLTSYASIYKIEEADAQAFLDYVYATCEGYIPVYEKDPVVLDEGITENAPLETVVQSSKGKE